MVQVHNDFFPDWPNMATKADMGVKNIRTPFEMLISFSSSLQYIHVKLCCRGSSSNSTNFTRSCCHKKSSIVDAICHIFIELSKNGTINWTFWIFPVSSALRGGLLWLISVNIIGVYYWSIESSNLISQWLHFSCIILWAASQSPFFHWFNHHTWLLLHTPGGQLMMYIYHESKWEFNNIFLAQI